MSFFRLFLTLADYYLTFVIFTLFFYRFAVFNSGKELEK